MYVAMTRARARLYLSCAQARMLHGRVRYNIRSRFLDELPDGALHWLSPRERRGGGYGELLQFSKIEADASASKIAPDTSAAKIAAVGAQPGSVAGQRVFHPKFGEGRVLAVQGQGQEAKAQVRFARHGTKWLLLDKARLTLIGDDE